MQKYIIDPSDPQSQPSNRAKEMDSMIHNAIIVCLKKTKLFKKKLINSGGSKYYYCICKSTCHVKFIFICSERTI